MDYGTKCRRQLSFSSCLITFSEVKTNTAWTHRYDQDCKIAIYSRRNPWIGELG